MNVGNKIDKIEKEIYSYAYDELSDYSKGIRDIINYLNNGEQTTQEDIIGHVLELQ